MPAPLPANQKKKKELTVEQKMKRDRMRAERARANRCATAVHAANVDYGPSERP